MTSSTDPANVLTAEFQTPILQPIQLWDQTLRDGEQTPKLAFTQDEKIELAHAIDSLGVFGMNVGYPAVSAYEAETVRKIARLGLRAELATTSRLVREDVDAVASVGVQWAFTFVSLSDWHIRDKLNTTEEKLLEKVYDVIPYAISKGLKVAFAIEDATRTPMPRMLKFIQAAEEVGASCIRICDTVGILTQRPPCASSRPCVPPCAPTSACTSTMTSAWPPPTPCSARKALDALRARLANGTFPELYDFNVQWGYDIGAFRNVDPDSFALANDGAGNYRLLCADGAVRSWSHDEGGSMEDHNSLASLDDAMACLVHYAAVREEHVPLDDVRSLFEEKGADNGWSFFLEILEDV